MPCLEDTATLASISYTADKDIMLTTIDIDEKLLADAMALTGQSTTEATVAEALRRVQQGQLDKQRIAGELLAGIGWDGDLDSMREGRTS